MQIPSIPEFWIVNTNYSSEQNQHKSSNKEQSSILEGKVVLKDFQS